MEKLKKKNDKKILDFWKGKKPAKPESSAIVKEAQAPAYRATKFLGTGTRYEGEGRKKNLFSDHYFIFPKKRMCRLLHRKALLKKNSQHRKKEKVRRFQKSKSKNLWEKNMKTGKEIKK